LLLLPLFSCLETGSSGFAAWAYCVDQNAPFAELVPAVSDERCSGSLGGVRDGGVELETLTPSAEPPRKKSQNTEDQILATRIYHNQ